MSKMMAKLKKFFERDTRYDSTPTVPTVPKYLMDEKMGEKIRESIRLRAKALKSCVPAHKAEYETWLNGFLTQGGEITHRYDYKFPGDSFFVAQSDMTLPPLHGSLSLELIVPVGIHVEYEDLGHNTIYFMDEFRCAGGGVFRYNNMILKDTPCNAG